MHSSYPAGIAVPNLFHSRSLLLYRQPACTHGDTMRLSRALVLTLSFMLPPSTVYGTAQSPATSQAAQATQEPTPDASGVYKVGNGVTPPKVIYSVEPEFSELGRKKKISGTCAVQLTVLPDGSVSDVHVIKSIAEDLDKKSAKKLTKAAISLDDMAVKAVKQYKFQPATLHGKPVPVHLSIGVNFQIF